MVTPAEPSQAVRASDAAAAPLTRRGFLKFTLAGSATLVVGGAFGAEEAGASLGIPELGEILDFADAVILAEAPYALNLILEVTADDRVRFELPRLDKGQGIATALAMIVADEIDADYERIDVYLSDRRAGPAVHDHRELRRRSARCGSRCARSPRMRARVSSRRRRCAGACRRARCARRRRR